MNLSMAIAVVGGALALMTLPGTLEILMLTVASLFWRGASDRAATGTLSMAVIVPAHNEAETIGPCLESLAACNRTIANATVIVVADNCTDRTVTVARKHGARVLVRNDILHRGKGHALAFAFAQLLREPFEAFMVVDADTTASSNFLDRSARRFLAGADAVQCRYIAAPPHLQLRSRLMHLALLAFHVIRPRGRQRLGFSAGIFGNGFGLARQTLEAVPYCTSSIAEDLEYHIALVRRGKQVVFEDAAMVQTPFLEDEGGARVQRARWEGGRLRLMADRVPSLLKELLAGNRRCAEALLDLLTLPLAFHGLLLLAAGIAGPHVVRWYAAIGLGILAGHLLVAVATAGTYRDLLTLLTAPVYVLWKIVRLPMILGAAGKHAAWRKTPRRRKRDIRP